MGLVTKDEDIEERIYMEIIVDAYDEYERIAGWYSYLSEVLQTPFRARCIKQRSISPLQEGDEIKVLRMAEIDSCENEMFVLVAWPGEPLTVPLAQLETSLDTDYETRQAVEAWHYWVVRGYEF